MIGDKIILDIHIGKLDVNVKRILFQFFTVGIE